MKKHFILGLFFVFLSVLQAQEFSLPANQPKSAIQTLSTEIHIQLDNLKQQSRNLTEQLLIAETELQTSSAQVEILKMELKELNTCLMDTNQKLTDYSTKLTEYEIKLKKQKNQLILWWVILGITVIIKCILLWLKIKLKIEIPYIINIFL